MAPRWGDDSFVKLIVARYGYIIPLGLGINFNIHFATDMAPRWGDDSFVKLIVARYGYIIPLGLGINFNFN
jgi:hypothetical protein